jgi:hypothetical protein
VACALLQLPALLSEDHATLTAELTGSQAAAVESRAAAAALRADLKAADGTTASLRKQLKEAEVCSAPSSDSWSLVSSKSLSIALSKVDQMLLLLPVASSIVKLIATNVVCDV